jgi:serine phosphatase RsbU (regulator of sigma subunit)
LSSFVIIGFKYFKLAPVNFFTLHANYFGIVLEILFFSLALANRIRLITREQRQTQKENLRLISEQKDMLEAKVRERTAEVEKINTEMLAQNEELHQQQEELIAVNDNLESKNRLIEAQKAEIDVQIANFEKANARLKSNEDILKKSYAKLKESESKIKEQNAEMLVQNEELTTVNEKLETTFKELKTTSDRLNKSIQYANQIQQVILPQKSKLDSFFSEHFITYLPKDVVSGDFYWFTLLAESKAIFVLADCTGHGVPGAFMSMIGNTLLHEITKTKNIHSPAEILLTLHQGIRTVLKQEESKNSDGMDISVCLFEKDVMNEAYKVTFAGAKSSIFYIKDSQITQLDGDRITIGGFTERKREFTNQIFTLKEGEVIYFTSDGYIDQHNFERRRFSSSKFKELLSNIYKLSIKEQEKVIIAALKDHQKNEEQRDDISVVGIRL